MLLGKVLEVSSLPALGSLGVFYRSATIQFIFVSYRLRKVALCGSGLSRCGLLPFFCVRNLFRFEETERILDSPGTVEE